jgi:hypothetical protein
VAGCLPGDKIYTWTLTSLTNNAFRQILLDRETAERLSVQEIYFSDKFFWYSD